METFATLLALCAGNSPVIGEFPPQSPVTRSFDVFFDLRLNKWLSKQSWGWWFERRFGLLWRRRNATNCGHHYRRIYVFNQWIVWDESSARIHMRICSTILHYGDVIMGEIASKVTSLKIVYSAVYSEADHRKQQSSAPLAFVRGIHRGPVNSPHKWPVTRKMMPFDDVIME